VTEWHFDKHLNGWCWRCTTDHGEIKSMHCFPDIRDALADAALHGYTSGTSRIGSMGPVPEPRSRLRRKKPTPPSQMRLILRRNLQARWIWELRSYDGHLLNRSDTDFETRDACETDARANGQSVDPPSGERG